MKKALPALFALFFLWPGISPGLCFPSASEAVSVDGSSLRSSGYERGVSLLAQAEPAPSNQETPGETKPVETAPAAPEQATPPMPTPQASAGEKPAAPETPAPAGEAVQPPPQPAPVPPFAPGQRRFPPAQQPGQAGLPTGQAGGAPVSFFFDDADIYEVIQTVFGDVLKVNYVIDPKVQGRVTFRTVTPIPKDEVLSVMEIILRINGVGYVEEKGLYRIIPLSDVPSELVYSQVGKEPGKVAIELFTFKNMNLKDSMNDIQNVIGLNVQGGTMRIIPIQRLNALMVVTSSKEQMEYVRKWVELFDAMFANARPKISVYPLQNSKADHIAQMLQSILGAGGGSVGGGAAPAAATAAAPKKTPTTGPQAQAVTPPPKPGPSASSLATGGGGGTGFLVSPETKIFADEITNSLVILSIPADYPFIEETIKKLDSLPRQVVIEGLLVRVDITDNLDFGMQWSIQNNLTIKPFGKNINFKGPLSLSTLITPDALANPAMFQFTALDAAGKVKLALQSLATLGKAKILASPHILVSDNREAKIQVGSEVPLATSTTSEPLAATTTLTSGLAQTSTIQYKDIGIILKVKPQINDSGVVSLEVDQEVSSLGSNVPIAGQDFASINKTEVTTNLVAKDGETIIIGGLIREDTTKSRSGIPFLSRIPLLGYLFGSTNDDTTRSELIILLTPHVARNLEEASGVTSEYIEKYRGEARDKAVDQFIKERGQSGGKPDAGNGK